MSGKNWAPGFIWVTPVTMCDDKIEESPPVLVAVTAILGVAESSAFRAVGMECSRLEITETEVSVLGSPDQIADLIRDNWEKRISGEAAMGAEYGSGDYKIGKDGWT